MLAICIFFSLYLLESAENRRERIFAAVFAALQAETFLLNFSLGATGFFLICAVVYLICAGQRRGSVLIRMLEIALPVLISVVFSYRFFGSGNSAIELTIPELEQYAEHFEGWVNVTKGWEEA